MTVLDLVSLIRDDGFAFVGAPALREMLGGPGDLPDWDRFRESWNALDVDEHMADGGRYRRRRHATYRASGAGAPPELNRQPHQPHFQAIDYNPLNGGIERWFAPVADDIGTGASLQAILRFCQALFGALAPTVASWHVEVHQFRIEARPGEQGRPTPEGLHRDGVDYVLVLLIDRRNIASGMTTIHALDGRELGHFTLTKPFDAALVDDARVSHGVTPVQPLDAGTAAYRDVLVVTFRRT
jgi:hypothetical protein